MTSIYDHAFEPTAANLAKKLAEINRESYDEFTSTLRMKEDQIEGQHKTRMGLSMGAAAFGLGAVAIGATGGLALTAGALGFAVYNAIKGMQDHEKAAMKQLASEVTGKGADEAMSLAGSSVISRTWNKIKAFVQNEAQSESDGAGDSQSNIQRERMR